MNKFHLSKRKIISVFVLIIGISIISTIAFRVLTKVSIRNDLLLKTPSCNLPCWNNITPGRTTKENAIEILERISYIGKIKISNSISNDSGGCSWQWTIPGKRITPNIKWKNNIVNEISFGLPFDLTVEEVIYQFGPPEALGIIQGGTPEFWYWVVDMYYPQMGLQMKAYTLNFSSRIDPSTEIGAFLFYPPSSLEERFSSQYPEKNPSDNNNFFKFWSGYGDLQNLYDINQN